MTKIVKSLLYLTTHPFRAANILRLYRKLNGRYKITIVMAHAFTESYYSKIKDNVRIVDRDDTERNIQKPVNQQMIINIHNGLLHTGGLTDRIKGICTLYNFAKTHNYKFKISFVHPFRLEKYLMPNKYDWTIEESAIIYDLNHTAIYTWENESLAADFFESNTDKLQLHIGCNSGECTPNYSELFHELFRPSQMLSSALEYHLQKLSGAGKYISVSLRFQNLLGEFEEFKSIALSHKQRGQLINDCLSAIENIKRNYPEIDKILITSDSNLFREIATTTHSYIYTFILPEEIGHIDYAAVGKSKELTAFLDMFLISRAKKAYQIRNAKMYNSDFPNMSAKISNIPYEMILID